MRENTPSSPSFIRDDAVAIIALGENYAWSVIIMFRRPLGNMNIDANNDLYPMFRIYLRSHR